MKAICLFARCLTAFVFGGVICVVCADADDDRFSFPVAQPKHVEMGGV